MILPFSPRRMLHAAERGRGEKVAEGRMRGADRDVHDTPHPDPLPRLTSSPNSMRLAGERGDDAARPMSAGRSVPDAASVRDADLRMRSVGLGVDSRRCRMAF